MVGYCSKDSGQAHYRYWAVNVSAAEIARAKETYSTVQLTYNQARREINKSNMGKQIYQVSRLHTRPHPLPVALSCAFRGHRLTHRRSPPPPPPPQPPAVLVLPRAACEAPRGHRAVPHDPGWRGRACALLDPDAARAGHRQGPHQGVVAHHPGPSPSPPGGHQRGVL